MSVYSGQQAAESGGGSVTFSGTGTPYNCHSVTVSRNVTTHPSTVIGSVETQRTRGLGDSSGTLSCYLDSGSAPVAAGETGVLTATMYNGRTFTIDIIVQSYDVNFVADGLCEVTYRWEQAGDGTSDDFAAA